MFSEHRSLTLSEQVHFVCACVCISAGVHESARGRNLERIKPGWRTKVELLLR